ncbi:MAG: preprotein translocase subunit Sec61beta [Desulfurococcaceae archaeon]|nr:preprotein translocase subunit Sec61beta [Desulfurococcaceae archaeon]
MCGVSSKKKKRASMMSGAGLVRFFEEVEAKVSISPYQLVLIAIMFSIAILVLGYLAPVLVP